MRSFLILTLLPFTAFSLEFVRNTNSYKDLLVSISPDLPETDAEKIIENIKTWISEGSRVLYSTSEGWARINNVNILIPSSWHSLDHLKPQKVHFYIHEDAEIRVEATSPVYGDFPTTVQNGECGEQGDFIQVSDVFLTAHVPDPAKPLGPPGQLFVYEWSQFRYGVFSEHGYPGDKLYPMFYGELTENGNVMKTNLCTNVEPEGSRHSGSGSSCVTDPSTGLPTADCRFDPTGPASLHSSIMALPQLEGADQWCSQADHQDDLPTKHNVMCGGKSVAEVVKQHPDFSGFQTASTTSPPPAPTFNVISPIDTEFPYVFVLDFSGSMDGVRVNRMKQGVKRFLKVDADDALKLPVGIVTFTDTANIAQEIKPVVGTQFRQTIIDSVDQLSAGGGTCLEKGVEKGLEALRNYRVPGGGVIFLTDGQDGCSAFLDAIDDVVDQNVRVCTIALGSSADHNIETLSQRTNGKAYYINDNGAQDEMNNALSSCLDFLPSIKTKDKTEIIIQRTFTNVKQVVENIDIDAFTGRSVSVQIDYDVEGEVTIYNQFEGTSTTVSGSGVITFTTPVAKKGQYQIKVSSKNPSGRRKRQTGGSKIKFVTLLVKSQAPEDVVPITMDCWTNVGAEDVILTGQNEAKLIIYSKAVQGLSPVISADVSASVTSDSGSSVIALKDDGVSPDNVKNDGIYSAYFTDFKPNQGKSRYSLVCHVAGTDETKVVKTATKSSSTLRCCGSTAVNEETPLSPTGAFTRTKSGGAISVGQTPANTNIFPPGPIRDLRVGDFGKDSFSLSFTSPGADLNTGTIKQFIIFYSENKAELNDELDPSSSVARLTEDHLACTGCGLDPLPPHSKVELSLGLKHFQADHRVFFRVLAVDDGGKTSLSNKANIVLSKMTNKSAPGISNTFQPFLILTSIFFVFNILL